MRKIQRAKPPRPRPGLDDPTHLVKVRALPCLIRGKRGFIRKWAGVYPYSREVTFEVIHQCSGTSDAHHVIRKSQRGSDRQTAPLCRAGHSLLHSMGQAEFEAVFAVDLAAEARHLAPKGETR